MNNKSNNFNKIAKLYDFLSFLIFGNSIKRSQLYFLDKIPAQSKVLIVGGGTGWYLKKILTTCQCKKIIYVEGSSEMVKLTKKKITGIKYSADIEFIEGDLENVSLNDQFDVIVTNYFLDLFKEEKLLGLMMKINFHLKEEGIWLFSDFQINQKSLHWHWQKILLKIMYAFFKLTSNVDNRQLPSYEKYFSGLKLKRIQSKNFYLGMIESVVYKKVSKL